MRLATFTLPTVDNNGVDLTDTHHALRLALCDTFGGFTSVTGSGGWRSPTGVLYLESVLVYSIAMPDSSGDRAKLESIALFYGDMANQLAVTVTHANGEVVFMDVAPTMAKSKEFT